MIGTINCPFGLLFADTVNTHGSLWARDYYMRRGMAAWEFRFWMRTLRGVR